MKRLFVAICLVTTLLFAGVVSATTITGTLSVTASVPDSCTVSSATLAFGNYSIFAGDLDSDAEVTVRCTISTSYRIDLDNGLYYSGSARKMINGSYLLAYELYKDVARLMVWGSGPDGESGTGTGVNESHTVYGRIPGSQSVGVGSYSDTVMITVNY